MKKRPAAVQASTVAKVVALSIFLGGSGVGYVFQNSQIKGLEGQLKANAGVLGDLEITQHQLQNDLNQATRRDRLQELAQHFHLNLQQPPIEMLRRLPEPQTGPPPLVTLAVQRK